MVTGNSATRNLKRNDLGGVIFGCTNATMGQCIGNQLFGLPLSHFSYVKNIQVGLTLFLFNYTDRKLYGIYEAASAGGMNIDSYAWTEGGKQKTGYPAQVCIRVRMHCQSIPESQFKKVIADNYYRPRHFSFELSHTQTERLIDLFLASNPQPTSATTNGKLLSYFQSEPMNVNEAPPSNSKGDSGTNLTTHKQVEFGEPSLYYGYSVDEIQGLSRTFSEPQLLVEPMEVEGRGQVIESQPGLSSNFLSDTCIDYHSPYFPTDVDGLTSTTSDLCNVNTELVQIVKELKERAATLEKKQFESDLEIQKLRNVVKDSGGEIQQLKSCVLELESKIMRTMVSGNSIYLIGGYTGELWLSSLDSFSPSTDIIVPLKSMGSARSYTSAVALNQNLFVFGGRDGSSWFNTVECYSQRNEGWSLCPPLAQAKAGLAGATVNSKIFALGGGKEFESFSDVEMFDPVLGKWICNQSMLQKRFAPAAAQLHDVIYASGGFDGDEYLQTAERFDPRVGNWTKLPDMKSRRECHSMAVLNEKLYAIGGFDAGRTVSSVEIFDPRNNSWTESSSLNFARGNAAAVVLGGSVFVIGGVDDSNGVETVECYREDAGWESCNYKAIGKRWSLSAVVL